MAVRVGRARFLPGPAAPVEPAGSTIVFQDTFASGAFTNWASCQWKAGAAAARNDDCLSYNGTSQYSATVTSDGAGHPHAARFELRDGDVPFSTTERTEIGEPRGSTTVTTGDHRWIGWDMKFDATFPVPHPSSGWCSVWQWHPNDAAASSPFFLDVDTDDIIYLANNDASGFQRTPVCSVPRGVWQRWVIEVLFHEDNAVGFASLWIDGVNVLPHHARRTMIVGDTGNYFKVGLYRDPVNTATAIRWLDNLIMTAP